jgi:transcriptional regulator with XRE-family HTH domain
LDLSSVRRASVVVWAFASSRAVSDIESDRRTPTENLLRTMSGKLDLDFDELMVLGGRLGAETSQYVRDVPAAARLFRRISELKLDEAALKRLEDEIDQQA